MKKRRKSPISAIRVAGEEEGFPILMLMSGDHTAPCVGKWSLSSPIGIYVHIPFCRRRCGYCSFFVVADKQRARFLTSLHEEWRRRKGIFLEGQSVTLYLGGGTPSLLSPAEVSEIVGWLAHLLPLEVTLELNPEDSSGEKLEGYLQAGVTRLSIGVQSFLDQELAFLTRRHTAEQAKETVRLAHRVGFKEISVDLIHDLPHQKSEDLLHSIEIACSLPITHLSLYNLLIEENSPFYRKRKSYGQAKPSSEQSVEMVHRAVDLLKEGGLHRYEISAFARDGLVALHNSGYWKGRPFLGLGPSAHSFLGGARWMNQPHLAAYNDALSSSMREIPIEIDEIPWQRRQRELFAMHLRLLEGVELGDFVNRFGTLDDDLLTLIDELIALSLFEREGDHLRLTPLGVDLYDEVGLRLV